MSTSISVPQGEPARIRVFAVNIAPAEMQATLDRSPKADVARRLLNAPHFDTNSTEIFPASDLSGVGLSSYLTEGYAVEADQIAPDRAKLDALDGYLLLLFSDSFAGSEMRLEPGSDVTLIGTYEEFRPASATTPISADSAKPYSGVGGMTPPPQPRGRSGRAMVTVAAIVLLLLILWWAFT